MKRLVAALVILAAIIGAGIAEAVYVDGIFGELEERIAALESAIKNPSDAAVDEVGALTAWWENKRKNSNSSHGRPTCALFRSLLRKRKALSNAATTKTR